jgi:hypothetical protein
MVEILFPAGGRRPAVTTVPLDVSHLFQRYGDWRIVLQLDPRLAHLRDDAALDRLRHVLRGFDLADLMLTAQDKAPMSLGLIGAGSGAEAIGAAQIFRSLNLVAVTERDPLLLAEAAINIGRHVDAAVEVHLDEGNIYSPLAAIGRRVDLLYVDLTDIPFTAAPEAAVEHKAYCPPVARTAHDAVLNAYQLALAYRFLRSAPAALTARGSALVLLGARFPLGVLDRLAEAANLHFLEVRSWLQLQADAANVLGGFAEAESRAFDFYDFDAGRALLSGRPPPLGDELKRLLAPCRLRARDAMTAFRDGRRIGYTAHLILATPYGDETADPAAET